VSHLLCLKHGAVPERFLDHVVERSMTDGTFDAAQELSMVVLHRLSARREVLKVKNNGSTNNSLTTCLNTCYVLQY
jgi:hypothetical protein